MSVLMGNNEGIRSITASKTKRLFFGPGYTGYWRNSPPSIAGEWRDIVSDENFSEDTNFDQFSVSRPEPVYKQPLTLARAHNIYGYYPGNNWFTDHRPTGYKKTGKGVVCEICFV